VLASAREHTWCEPQRATLDWVVREFMDEAFEHDQGFDTERFAALAKCGFDRAPLITSDPTTESEGE